MASGKKTIKNGTYRYIEDEGVLIERDFVDGKNIFSYTISSLWAEDEVLEAISHFDNEEYKQVIVGAKFTLKNILLDMIELYKFPGSNERPIIDMENKERFESLREELMWMVNKIDALRYKEWTEEEG
jgi:hypothetical protein